MYCPKCGEGINVNFCSKCGAKLLDNPNEILASMKDIVEKANKETEKCEANHHDLCEITEKNRDCVDCLQTKVDAFRRIAEFFE